MRNASQIAAARPPAIANVRGRRMYENDVKSAMETLKESTPSPAASAHSVTWTRHSLYTAMCDGTPPVEWVTWALLHTIAMATQLPPSARQVGIWWIFGCLWLSWCVLCVVCCVFFVFAVVFFEFFENFMYFVNFVCGILCDINIVACIDTDTRLQEAAAVYCAVVRSFPLAFDSAAVNSLMKWISHSVADVILKEVSAINSF